MWPYKMAEIKKKSASVSPCGKGINIRWKHLIFDFIILCTLVDMLGYWAITLHSIEQIVWMTLCTSNVLMVLQTH